MSFRLSRVWQRTQHYFYVLVDETDLPNGWKALVASIPFRNRAIPIFWCVYEDEEIRNMTYKSHNNSEVCLKVNALTLSVLARHRDLALQMGLIWYDTHYSNVLYHQKHQIFCVVRDPAFKEPSISSQMFIKTLKSINATNVECRSNTGSETSRPASGSDRFEKATKARIALLWFIACLTYGLTFLCYEKDIQPVSIAIARHRDLALQMGLIWY